MTLLSLRRLDADDATLLRRAGRGDRRAHRLFARRHAARAVEIVDLLMDAPRESATLAATVLDATVAAGLPGDDALVRCAVQVLAPATNDTGLSRLVVALTDVEGRTDDTVAELINRPVEEVAELRTMLRSQLGAARSVATDCRGWGLAARRERLTVSEQEAAHGHLAVCRSCRGRLEEQRRTRDKLRMSGTAVSAVVVADVVALSVPAGGAVAGASGVASVLLGKVGTGVVGAAAVAVAATSVGVATARQMPSHENSPTTVSRIARTPGPTSRVAVPHNAQATTGTDGQHVPAPSATATTRQAPLPLPTLPVPTSPVPTSLVPTSPSLPTLPTTLPTTLPLPTSTSVTTLLPGVTATPSVPITVPNNVVSTATSLLGH